MREGSPIVVKLDSAEVCMHIKSKRLGRRVRRHDYTVGSVTHMERRIVLQIDSLNADVRKVLDRQSSNSDLEAEHQ
jgi:hypothetical protein